MHNALAKEKLKLSAEAEAKLMHKMVEIMKRPGFANGRDILSWVDYLKATYSKRVYKHMVGNSSVDVYQQPDVTEEDLENALQVKLKTMSPAEAEDAGEEANEDPDEVEGGPPRVSLILPTRRQN